MSERWDVWLFKNNFANSRTHADSLIQNNLVEYLTHQHWIKVTKSSHKIPPQLERENVRVHLGDANKYVSRGGLKLEGALRYLQLDVQNLRVLDLGISTGGFSDCLLQHHITEVVGVDVGHNQLHDSLKSHPQLYFFDGINVRHLSSFKEKLIQLQEPFDGIVGDLSFISLTLIIPELFSFLKPSGFALLLVKPQFELSPKELGKGGIVKDNSLYEKVREKIVACVISNKYGVIDFFESPITGKDGNKEFFIFFKKPQSL